jgi:anti-sigma regulatory factor (Ser/Thr protein kinase)
MESYGRKWTPSFFAKDARMDVNLPPTARAPGLARASVRQCLAEWRQDVRDTVELLTSELVTNSLLHAGLAPDQPIGLRMRVLGDRVRVEVTDQGGGFRPHPRRGPLGRGGYGLELVAGLASTWGVRPSRPNMVWFEVQS